MSLQQSAPTVRPLHRNVLTAVLAALQFAMIFTGVGYIPIGPLRLTVLTLPIAIGGALLGPVSGTVLGAVFGVSSFLTCIGVFAPDPFGAILVGIDPLLTAVMCIVPRILCGLLPALLSRLLQRWDKSKWLAFSSACLLTPALNTVLFMSALWVFFADSFVNNAELVAFLGGQIASIGALFIAFAGVNAIVEAAVGLVLGTAVCKALSTLLRRMG